MQMVVNMQDPSFKTIFMEKEVMNGPTANATKAIGSETRCTAKVRSLGWMENSMLETMKMIRNTAMGSLPGRMEEFIRETGEMVNNMAREHTQVNQTGRTTSTGKRTEKPNEFCRKQTHPKTLLR